MPVVLEESQFVDWMRAPPELAAEMMKPYGGAIDIWEVGKDVGSVRNTSPSYWIAWRSFSSPSSMRARSSAGSVGVVEMRRTKVSARAQ